MNKQSRNSPCWCGSKIKYKKCCYPEIKPETQFIIRQKPTNSFGTQPIKVLEHNILSFFEKTNKNFLEQVKNDIAHSDFKAGIKYDNSESKLDFEGLAYINSNKQIHIQETFLSFIWIVSYCLVRIFDEHILTPRKTNNIDHNIDKLNGKLVFLDYGLSLMNKFSVWDIDKYPNPEKYLFSEKHNVEKVNSVFLHAVNFVLCHEYSHFSLKHVDNTIEAMSQGKEVSPAVTKIDEINADYNAIQMLLRHPRTKRHKKNIEYGIVCGLSALILMDTISIKKKYPDPEIRLSNALNQFNLKDEDLHWGLASLTLRIWTYRLNAKMILPKIVDTYKHCFELMLLEIDKMKKINIH